MIDGICRETEDKMEKPIELLKRELATVRTGRASVSLLDHIRVDCYGSLTPIQHVAGITIPESRLIVIQPWDKSVLEAIEKAILKSNLGLNPTNDGKFIRLVLPPLTEERRKELVKVVKKLGEECRIVIRNLRREAIEKLKKLKNEGKISEDDERGSESRIQKLTDKYIEMVDNILKIKEEEIMQV